MKATENVNKPIKTEKPALKAGKGYYFHADEDFREDWDWGKTKMKVSKSVTKPVNKLEI